jgi:hypothetical protein
MSDNFIFLVAGRPDDTRLFRLLLGMFRLLLGVRLGFTGTKADTIVGQLLSRLCSKYLALTYRLISSRVSEVIGFHGFKVVKSYEGTSIVLH